MMVDVRLEFIEPAGAVFGLEGLHELLPEHGQLLGLLCGLLLLQSRQLFRLGRRLHCTEE
jgi:hypothetical protein